MNVMVIIMVLISQVLQVWEFWILYEERILALKRILENEAEIQTR